MKSYVKEIIEPYYQVKLVATPRPDVGFKVCIARSDSSSFHICDSSSFHICGSHEALAKLVYDIRKEAKEKSDRIERNSVAMKASLLTLGFIEHES